MRYDALGPAIKGCYSKSQNTISIVIYKIIWNELILKNTKNIRNTYFHPVTSSPQPRKSSSTI